MPYPGISLLNLDITTPPTDSLSLALSPTHTYADTNIAVAELLCVTCRRKKRDAVKIGAISVFSFGRVNFFKNEILYFRIRICATS